MLDGGGVDGVEEVRERFAADEPQSATTLERKIAEIARCSPAEQLFKLKALAKEFRFPVGDLKKLLKAETQKQKAEAVAATRTSTQKPDEDHTGGTIGESPIDEEAIAAELYEKARPLAECDNILAEVEKQIVSEGYAGNTAPALRSYVAISSNCLTRPINLHRVAPPASGKNFTTDSVLPLFPEEDYYKLTASSERALIYSPASFKHRTLNIEEMDSIPAEGPAAAAIRSVVQDNRMSYEVVELDPDTKQHITRRIEKEGPTGLITTGTRRLEPQMATRVLEDSVLDTTEQTRRIMHTQAEEAEGKRDLDLSAREKFVSFRRWLRLKGERQIVVPFASVLVDLMPADHVRMRRDNRQILTTIQTIAFIHQAKREKDNKGRVVAIPRDYEIARDLLSPVLDAIVSDGVTPEVRATVAAVGEGVLSVVELAERLQLRKSTASARWKAARRLGYLANLEKRKGWPAQITRALPLPEPQHALPTVEKLTEEIGRRCAARGLDLQEFLSGKPE
jgi:hypothetical protein